jgi:signal transduction histidine kinase
MGRRLYLRLYLAFLGVLLGIVVISAVVTAVVGRGFFPTLRRGPRIAAHLARTLPGTSDPSALVKAVEQAGDELGLDVAVVDQDGELVASAGSHIPRPGEDQLQRASRGPGWISPGIVAAPLRTRPPPQLPAPGSATSTGPVPEPAQFFVLVHVPFPDSSNVDEKLIEPPGGFPPEHGPGPEHGHGPGRGSGLRPPIGILDGPPLPPQLAPGRGWGRALFFLFGGLVLSAALLYPLSRSITRPLERLTASVEAFGKGDLKRRSGIVASDEVGRLARSFDEMAARIEAARRGEKELLANVSHELRTPLQRVKLALELIDTPDGEAGDALRKRLTSVGEEIDELGKLVGEILTASRLDLSELPLVRAQVDLRDLLEKARARAQALSAVPAIEVAAPAGLKASLDEALLGRLIDNLLDNARKYGGGTPVRLEASAGDRGGVKLTVSDSGPGFPPEDLPRIFETFFRGSNARGRESGYGLGLSLAKRVAEAHGGAITAKNRSEGGALLELVLPAV